MRSAGALLSMAVLALAACKPDVEGHPNAPGSPGTGNPTVKTAPGAPDTPPGGPSGVKGSLPHTGSSGGDAIPGTTGRGSAGAPSGEPGAGLGGGLGGAAASSPGGTATVANPSVEGSRNRTTSGSTGN